jgi:hypothetical protein
MRRTSIDILRTGFSHYLYHVGSFIKLIILFILFIILFSHCNEYCDENCSEGTIKCNDEKTAKIACLCSYNFEYDFEEDDSDCEDCHWYIEEYCRESGKTCVENRHGATCQK